MGREIKGLKMEIWGCGMGDGKMKGNWYEMKMKIENVSRETWGSVGNKNEN